MMGFGKQSVEPNVSAFWRARSAALHHKLTENPAAREAWFWRIQCNIVDYLLHRYGTFERQHLSAGDANAAALEGAINPASGDVHLADSLTVTGDTGKQPRPPEEMRPVLQFISHINQYRYETLTRMDNELAESLRFERERIRDIMPQLTRPRPIFGPIEKEFIDAQDLIVVATLVESELEGHEDSDPDAGSLGDREAAEIAAAKVVVEAIPEDAIDRDETGHEADRPN